jgi:uncharacterized membrane protein
VAWCSFTLACSVNGHGRYARLTTPGAAVMIFASGVDLPPIAPEPRSQHGPLALWCQRAVCFPVCDEAKRGRRAASFTSPG